MEEWRVVTPIIFSEVTKFCFPSHTIQLKPRCHVEALITSACGASTCSEHGLGFSYGEAKDNQRRQCGSVV